MRPLKRYNGPFNGKADLINNVTVMAPSSSPNSPMASATWPLPANSEQCALGWQRLEEAAAANEAIDLEWAQQAEPKAMLDALFGNSPHLTDIAIKQFETLQGCWTSGPDIAFETCLNALKSDGNEPPKLDNLTIQLRHTKQQANLIIALADISQIWPLEQITSALSRLADVSLQTAIRALVLHAGQRGDLELSDGPNPEQECGYVVLAMGKLGACELNYSSDIDLIVLYNPDKARTKRPDSLPQTFQRITRDLIKIMEERTADGYVFRTDLRLRPDPGSTPIALASSTAELYYASLARTWERAAMIKARPCAGDIAEGHRFLSEIAPFIWRVSLDFAVVEEISDMRARVAARATKKSRQTGGYDVKLGPGGIRDIEFFVQTQQLTFGGREVALRTPRTLDGLQALVQNGHIGRVIAESLARAYRYWRGVEHRLQMIDDQQTHQMPDKPAKLDQIACFLGYADRPEMETELKQTQDSVERVVTGYFGTSNPDEQPSITFDGADPEPETLTELENLGFEDPDRVFVLVNGWMRGRARATRTERGRQLLARLAPTLVEQVAATSDPMATLVRWDRFISGLPTGIQLFALLSNHPNLISILTDLLSAAPIIADNLTSQPDQLDALLLPDFLTQFPTREELTADLDTALSVRRHHEETLSIIRRWMNDQRLRTAVHLFKDPKQNPACMAFLSCAIEVALIALLPLVVEDFAERHGRIKEGGIAVIALGKLGSEEMTIGSDLDLIVVFDAPEDAKESDGEKPLGTNLYYARLTQRLITAMTAPMKVGILFDLDMRLRPSGNAGPLATSLDGFIKYQTTDAWTWEHMALTRARVVAGPPALNERLQQEISKILRTARPVERTVTDIREMRGRITDQLGTTDIWDVKYARGGLIDIGFLVQYFQLTRAKDLPDILDPSTSRSVQKLADLGMLQPDQASLVSTCLDLCLQVQAHMRVAIGRTLDVTEAEPQVKRGLARIILGEEASASDFDKATEQFRTMQSAVYDLYKSIIGEDLAQN